MTRSPLRRLQELAGGWASDAGRCSRATKEANLAGCPSECNRQSTMTRSPLRRLQELAGGSKCD
jgi:hypothetical protein